LDLSSGRCGWLAHVNQKNGPQVGKYRVNIEDLNTVGAQAITDAVKKCEVIAIDEIGPMELFSKRFKDAVRKALESHKLILAVVHWKAQDTLINEAKKREDAETTSVTLENRESLHKQITENALKILKHSHKHAH
jgi:nucleoside-triphosphatase